MRSKKSDLNNFKKHLTISLSIDPSLSIAPSLSKDPFQESSLQRDISSQHTPGIQRHAPANQSAGTQATAVIEISSSWMAASLENALKTIKDSSVVVSGFRPGKAPAQLLRKKKTPMAIDTMLNWILQDLGEVLDSYDSFQILTPGNFSFEPSWREGEPFRVEATFNCWLFPDLSTDDIFEAIAEEATNQGRVVDTGAESLDWLGDVLGQLFVPHIPLEVQGLMIQFYLDQKGSKGSNDEREEALVEVSRILGAAFMIKRLGIETSEDDIEKGIGLVASEIGASFYDLYDKLMDEAGLQNYRQHLQMMAALSAIARRVSVRQSNENTAPPVADREVTTP